MKSKYLGTTLMFSVLAALRFSSQAYSANITLGPGLGTPVSSTNQFMGIGDSNVFAGVYSQLAVGDGNEFDDESSGIIVGWDSEFETMTYASMALGYGNSMVQAPYSCAIGEYNTIENPAWLPGGFVAGSYNMQGNQLSSIVLGYGNSLVSTDTPNTFGMGSLVVGLSNSVDSGAAWVLGAVNGVTGLESVTIGGSLENHYRSALVVGRYNDEVEGDRDTLSGNGPAFILGNGTSSRSNAIVTLMNGETTLINKAWNPSSPLATPAGTDNAEGRALVVDGHTQLRGKVIIEPQGDIAMGIYGE